ncbi:MAG: DUF2961 domain-containing protein [Phycisphaerae bacterium]|nr:DUF2961 domain-containing protein [Phycisphaerae bacterium]
MKPRGIERALTLSVVGFAGIGLCVGCSGIEKPGSPATVTAAKPVVPLDAETIRLTMTYDDLLTRMIDLEALAEAPKPGETCRQFSSYDRKSRIDAGGVKLDWEANADFGKYLRKEGDAYVMAEMDGPGCIVRIWSANPMGTLKIYLDEKPEPVLAEDFSGLTSGKVSPFTEPIVGVRSRGANIYLPIPYQRKCKVVVEKAKQPERMYYAVDYWTYTPEARVPTWSKALLDQHMETYKKVCGVLSDPSGGPSDLPKLAGRTLELKPGGQARLDGQRGPAAIRALKVKLTAKDVEHALREVAVSIRFDGPDKAQVWAPLGDFFGTAPGVNAYKSLPLGMAKDGWMYCYWPMPYRSSAEVTFQNDGKQDVSLEVQFATSACEKAGELLTFHAGWRRDTPNTTFDWPFLECMGRGRFVGVAMFVFNPVKQWWGEGDEKVWVDGESFPSWYGTGSEDYFGYAWCCNQRFFHAYHNQPRCDGPGNQNHSSVNRFHIIDNIPFQKSFQMTIENYGKDKDYSCTTYWYATADSHDFFMPLPVHRRGIAGKAVQPAPMRIQGAIEGEALKIVGKQTTGACDPQELSSFGSHWSGNGHLWFRPGKAGEWVELELPVAKDGKYTLVIHGTKAGDYGIVQYWLDGKKVGQPIDGYHDGVVPTKRVELGVVELKKGTSKLKMEVTGKNGKSTGFMAGLDCVVLEPVQ